MFFSFPLATLMIQENYFDLDGIRRIPVLRANLFGADT